MRGIREEKVSGCYLRAFSIVQPSLCWVSAPSGAGATVGVAVPLVTQLGLRPLRPLIRGGRWRRR